MARELGLKAVDKAVYLTSVPVKELNLLESGSFSEKTLKVKGETNLTNQAKNSTGLFRLDFEAVSAADFSIVLSNKAGNELIIGYDKAANQYYTDRSKSGKVDFEEGFGVKHTAPRISKDKNISLTLIADAASVELFADGGLTAMTKIFFPDEPMSELRIKSVSGTTLSNLKYSKLKSALSK
nr:GH32 C-terminal domain-containing protein [Dyadobacter crusticola]